MTVADRERLRCQIADRLAEMEPMFDARCRLTFIMRAPHLADGDVVVTSDEIQDVITALQRLAGYSVIV